MVTCLKDSLFDQSACSEESQKTSRVLPSASFKTIKRDRLDNASIQLFSAPSLVGNLSGNQRIPLLADYERPGIVLREITFAIGAPKQDEPQQQYIRGDGDKNSLEHESSWT